MAISSRIAAQLWHYCGLLGHSSLVQGVLDSLWKRREALELSDEQGKVMRDRRRGWA